MFRKIFILPFFLCAVLALSFSAVSSTSAAPASTLYTIEDNSGNTHLESWVGNNYANLGFLISSDYADATAQFRFSGTDVVWITAKSPSMGKAQVILDGVTKGIVDLYAPTSQSNVQFAYGNLANGKHTIVVKVLGQGNPAANDTYVVIDGFMVGGVKTDGTSSKIKYNSWKGIATPYASGGTYRVSAKANRFGYAWFGGTSVSWVTVMGPKYGKARVAIDNVNQGVVDLYSPTQQWQVVKTFSGLSQGQHYITISVLHKKNKASAGYNVAIDAFRY